MPPPRLYTEALQEKMQRGFLAHKRPLLAEETAHEGSGQGPWSAQESRVRARNVPGGWEVCL